MWKEVLFVIKKTKESNPTLFFLTFFLKTFFAFLFIADLLAYKIIIDAAGMKNSFFGLPFSYVIIFLFGYFLFSKLLFGLITYLQNILDVQSLLHLNKEFINKVNSLDLTTFENPNTVGLVNRAFNRFQYQIKLYFSSISMTYASFIEAFVSLFVFIYISPFMGIAILIANLIPLYVRTQFSYGVFNIYKADDETKRKFGYLTNTLLDRVTLPEIKLNSAFTYFKHEILTLYKRFTTHQLKEEQKGFIFVTLAELIPLIVTFIFFYYAGIQYQNGLMTSGVFVILFINGMAFFSRLKVMSQNMGELHSSSLLIKDAIDFFDITPTTQFIRLTKDDQSLLIPKLISPIIRIENVSFTYPNTSSKALNNISFTVPFGQNLALIGENGAGKSTLVKLLLRMYDPTEGTIYINNINIKEIPERVLFAIYSTLFQSFGRFYISVRDNLEIAAGKKLSEEEMKKYLQFANSWEFIKDTKNVYDQQLGPEYTDGIDLSGGQWQRLAIARAYAKQAPILILDEPTSAVDAKSEMEIFDRLIKEMKKNTLIFISHRFSTIKDAERIIVLDKGKIIEDGNHQTLIQNKSKYEELYTIQAERYAREGIPQ